MARGFSTLLCPATRARTSRSCASANRCWTVGDVRSMTIDEVAMAAGSFALVLRGLDKTLLPIPAAVVRDILERDRNRMLHHILEQGATF